MTDSVSRLGPDPRYQPEEFKKKRISSLEARVWNDSQKATSDDVLACYKDVSETLPRGILISFAR